MKKILFVFGTRPEAIKLAPVILELQKFPEVYDVKVCVTGQHREMLDSVMKWFSIKPDYDLNVMKKNQDLFDITSSILIGIKDVYDKTKPDYVFVQGDTSTVMTAAIGAFYKKLPICHVEAGLRTNDLQNPYPEEFNRKVTSIATKFHLAPTNGARDNLLKENIDVKDVYVTGNTVIDALVYSVKKNETSNSLTGESGINYNKKIVLITAHRRENFGDPFINLCNAIKQLSDSYPDVEFVYPVHLNPNVQSPVNNLLANKDNIHLIQPLNYEQFVAMMMKSYIILTDSGGVQEEAPALGKPVLVMREKTERPEAVSAGAVKLVGTNTSKIFKNVSVLLDNEEEYSKMSNAINPYGDGHASSRIECILSGKQYTEFIPTT